MDPNRKVNRLDLHEELVNVLGSRNVYFVPDQSIRLRYPCIIYQLEREDIKRANNKPYLLCNQYQVTVISYDPDSDEFEGKTITESNADMQGDSIIERLLYHFEWIERATNRYVVDNLNHDVFTLYY